MPTLPTVDFRDVTTEAPAAVHFPHVVAEFENLGFLQVGRMARVISPHGHATAARLYPRRHRAEFLRMTAVPPLVLAAPDRSALVLLDWWWGMPEVRLRTLLTTGAVVETRRAWDRAPVWRLDVRRSARHLVLAEEQRLSDAKGRDVDVVVGGPAALWQAHRARVATYVQQCGGQPVAHQEMGDALALSRRLAAHDLRTERRRAVRVLAVCLLLVAVMTSALVLYLRLDSETALFLGAGVALTMPWLSRLSTRRLRYGRRSRPPFA